MKPIYTFNGIGRAVACMLLALLGAVSAAAQTDYISSSRDIESDRFEDLDGGYGLLIISPNKDLVFNVGNSAVKATTRLNGRNAKGDYEYYIIVDANETHRPKVEISRRGSVYKTELVQDLKADFMTAFRVEEIAVPIRLDNQTKPNDAYLDATKAELEFSTPISGLQVKLSPRLAGTETKTGLSKTDNKIFITSVVIPVEQIKQAKAALEEARNEHDALEKKLTSGSYNGTDAEWTRLDELEAKANEAAKTLSEMTNVEIFSEGTNRLNIDISDLGPRVKKCYAVLQLVIEKSVFVTECSAYMNEGARLFGLRKYGDARAAYFNALNAKDVIINMRPTINAAIAECDSCLFYEKLAVGAIKRFNEMRKNGNATQREAAKYASAASEFLGILNNYNPDEFYTSRIEKFGTFLADIPLSLKFTIVEWKTLHEGNALPGIEVWAYYGTEPLSATMFPTDRKFRKLTESRAGEFSQVSVSDGQGKAAIELNRKSLPKGFLFRPTGNKEVKIKYLDFNDLMRQATGTYMEKQFRLKMYVK